MLGLENLEIGLMFWAGEDARNTLRAVKEFGVRVGQLGFSGEMPLGGVAEKWDQALTEEHFTAVAAVCSYAGEDYTDIPAVARTVGLVPPATRKERIARIKAISDIAKELAIESVSCHIGFVPVDHTAPLYIATRDVARELCDYCKMNGQAFTLETGQEPAKVLLQFIEDVERPNLKVNFDPANMILYGTGEPLDALEALGKHVISVHCKDGDWPPRENPAALGQGTPLGEGKVNIPAFISKLKEVGYTAPLIIESEETDAAKRTADIHNAVKLLRKLTGRTTKSADAS